MSKKVLVGRHYMNYIHTFTPFFQFNIAATFYFILQECAKRVIKDGLKFAQCAKSAT